MKTFTNAADERSLRANGARTEQDLEQENWSKHLPG